MSDYRCENCGERSSQHGHYDIKLDEWKCRPSDGWDPDFDGPHPSTLFNPQMEFLRSSYMTVYAPKPVTYVDLPPDPKFTTDEIELGMKRFVFMVKTIVEAWYKDLMSDDTRLRYSLLELD